MISADRRQVVCDAGQEAMSQPRNGKFPGNLSSFTGFVQPVQQAIGTADIESSADAKGPKPCSLPPGRSGPRNHF
jgi:hypothetical protein